MEFISNFCQKAKQKFYSVIWKEGETMHENMPLTRFLEQYTASGTLRGHMPGHKGKPPQGFAAMQAAYEWDITEIDGADSLFEAEGILREGECFTAQLYGTADCCWSAGGSTLCIQAMLAKMQAEHRKIVAARTVHRSFLNACALLGLEVTWVFPRSGGMLAGQYMQEDFAAALRKIAEEGASACLYVTSPDYCGNLQDIPALAAICRKFGARLLVDHAHGVHRAFLAGCRHPIAEGADFCCESAHKMLPALTGAALLHCSEPCGMEMKQHMQLFGSTSPSYLVMQSIEASMHWLADGGISAIRSCAEAAAGLRERLPQYSFSGQDPLHLTISADGIRLAAALREKGIECEYADQTCLVLLLSPVWSAAEFAYLESVLASCRPEAPRQLPPLPSPPEQVISLREAALAEWECVPVREAVGRICGRVQVPCPPAVPILVSGERITAPWAEFAEYCGISQLAVMKR